MALDKVTKLMQLQKNINITALKDNGKVGILLLMDQLLELFSEIKKNSNSERYFVSLYISTLDAPINTRGHRVLFINATTDEPDINEQDEVNDVYEGLGFHNIFETELENYQYQTEIDKIKIKSILFDISVILKNDYGDIFK